MVRLEADVRSSFLHCSLWSVCLLCLRVWVGFWLCVPWGKQDAVLSLFALVGSLISGQVDFAKEGIISLTAGLGGRASFPHFI